MKEFTSKIIDTLLLSPEAPRLIVKFVRSCKPALKEKEDLQKYIVALAETSIADAWAFQRTFPSNTETRKDLLLQILTWCLDREYFMYTHAAHEHPIKLFFQQHPAKRN